MTPEQAAQRLFENPRAELDFTASDEVEARRAVEEFARQFEALPGIAKVGIGGASAAAETLSADRFQGLSEIIQNADDAHASFVEFRLIDHHLLAAHDGHPVSLSNVLGLATPWHSTKTADATATGRFGIGLMTLRALGDVLEMHSGPYHLHLGDPVIEWATIGDSRVRELEPGLTAIRIPLRDHTIDTDVVVDWFDNWDSSALLFLRHVERVSVIGADGADLRRLRLEWSDRVFDVSSRDAGDQTLRSRYAIARDGRRWLVHLAESPTPKGVTRAHKATDDTVPLGLALPLQPEIEGVIHAGLPVARSTVPVRVNAPFDPVTGRTDLADNAWNHALLPLLAELWAVAVEELFVDSPAAAWHVIPLPTERDDHAHSIIARFDGMLLDLARDRVSNRAAIVVDGRSYALTELAVEGAPLEGVLEPEEVAALSGLELSLPMSARDDAGRWREVLDDWAQAGAPLPEPVTVPAALELLGHTTRGIGATIALTAVALSENLEHLLAEMPCVVLSDGTHVVPPSRGSLAPLMTIGSPLAEQLGIGVRLAGAYLAESDDANAVLAWLQEIDAVVDDPRDESILCRLAAAGDAGTCMGEALSDDQLRALRDAFEHLPPAERTELGRGVGRAIQLAAVSYDDRKQPVTTHARPREMYLCAAVDRDSASFAVAADKTPGLLWTPNRYRTVLAGKGLGAQRFLGLLGVERTPRITPHPLLQRRYVQGRPGLPAKGWGISRRRYEALKRLNASWTLDDLDSPDLYAVATDIAVERKVRRRRERTRALLATLGRAWDRLEDKCEVRAAEDYQGWNDRGTVPAFWLWMLGEIEWLEDADGVLCAPLDLRVKTRATVAVHGPDASGYLRDDLDAVNRREVLSRLGVAGEPNTDDLIGRLRTLRNASLDHDSTTVTDAAIIYQALAERVPGGTTGRISERDLRAAFDDDAGLVLSPSGWRTPRVLLSGPPIFGCYRDFVPLVPGTEALWAALQIGPPTADDCIQVIRKVAAAGWPLTPDEQGILLETLRRLAGLAAEPEHMSPKLTKALRRLPILTTTGWTRERPVYATDDSALMDGLGAWIPVWDPGGQLTQFEALLHPLGIVPLDGTAAVVVNPDDAEFDGEITELFASAVTLMQDDLARNDPRTLRGLTIGWNRLRQFSVRLNPELRVEVGGLVGPTDRVGFAVPAKVDNSSDTLFLDHARSLRMVGAGGAAIASLFTGVDRRQLAQAWLAACIAVEEGRTAQRLELAEQQADFERDRTAQAIEDRRNELAREITNGQARRPAREASSERSSRGSRATGSTRESTSEKRRELVDLEKLSVVTVDPISTRYRRDSTAGKAATGSGLATPNHAASPPQSRTPAATFTPNEKEAKGLELLRLVLASNNEEIVDLRAQRNVGADAIDQRGRLFELKVFQGAEPDVLTLQASQVQQALQAGEDFFLVVVSNVEASGDDPQVRIIPDPLRQLTAGETSSVTLSGIRNVPHSVVCRVSAVE